MNDQTSNDRSSSYTSDLTRKLVDEVDILTRFAPDSGKGLLEDEDSVLSDLIKDYEHLDTSLRQELTDLATLLADDNGRVLRAAICRPGKASITVTDDAMDATMELIGPEGGGKALSTADIVSMLKERGIVFGVDIPAISSAVNDAMRGTKGPIKICIATGKEPVAGEPGRIELNIHDPLPARNPRAREWMVKAGDVVARLVPPTCGMRGTNVYGREVPAQKGCDATLAIKPGVTFRNADYSYSADFDGLAIYDGKQLELRRQLVWSGDLTMNDQPIEFDGAVIIQGTVCDGARVSASGDIEVSEGIEGASVISTAGSVTVKQGMTGRGRGYVAAKTLVDVKYVENGTVYCEGNIIVRHAALHSRLTAGECVKVELGKGAVFGGEIRAGKTIIAKSLGNVAGISTRLSVGHDWASLQKLQECEAAIALLHQQAALCEELISKFRRAKPQITLLTEAERNAFCTVLKRHVATQHRLRLEQDRCAKLDSECILKHGGEVMAYETIYAGTSVKIGPATVLISSNQSGCRVCFDTQDHHLVAISPSGRKSSLS